MSDHVRNLALSPHDVRRLATPALRVIARDATEPHYMTSTVQDARRVLALRLVAGVRGTAQALVRRARFDDELRGSMFMVGTRRQRRAAMKAHGLLVRSHPPTLTASAIAGSALR